MNKKLLLKRLSVIMTLFVLVISLPVLCGCKDLALNVLYLMYAPRHGTIPDPENFIKEHCNIDLPSEARVEYTFGVNGPKGDYSYFLVCFYPDTPQELLKYVESSEEPSITDEQKGKYAEHMKKILERVLKEGGSSLDELDEKYKPDWDSQFVTNWKKFDSPYGTRFEVYFPSTQRLLVWGEVG